MSNLSTIQKFYTMLLRQQKTSFYQLSTHRNVFPGNQPLLIRLPIQNTIASQECETADDYINSMIQSKITTIKSHSDPDYAPMPKPIRND